MEKEIQFEITEEGQKLAAVKSGGELFAARGGVPLMLTEFVENGNDAIKSKQVKYDKKLEKELVIIEFDTSKKEIRVIDTGSGILQPIHICKKPFISLKSGEDYTTGQFGRGSQVFRAFCDTLQFITLRDLPHQEELDYSNEPNKCIKLTFEKDKASGKYGDIDESEFKKYYNIETGTIAILKGWTDENFNRILKIKNEIIDRLQHHFGFELRSSKYNIRLIIKENNKSTDIVPRSYIDNSLIDEEYDLPPIKLQNSITKKSYGDVVFHIFKTTRKYRHQFKKPFLVVNNRPLGDSFIADIPELSEIASTWESNFITGYIICDGVKTNQLRVGLANDESKSLFFSAIQAATFTLHQQIIEWQNITSSASDKIITQEVATEIQRFFKKKGIKLNFKNTIKQGLSQESKGNMDESRISDQPGGENEGMIDPDGDDVDKIKFHKPNKKVRVKTKSKNKKNGSDEREVDVDRALVSKGGSKTHKIGTGPDITFYSNELEESEISYYEKNPPTVFINDEHKSWKNILKKNTIDADRIEKLKKRYMAERYMWELITNCYKIIDDQNAVNVFWNTYYDYLDG